MKRIIKHGFVHTLIRLRHGGGYLATGYILGGLDEKKQGANLCFTYRFMIYLRVTEGSHSGLVRAPAKRLPCESRVVGSNPTPSATLLRAILDLDIL